MSKVVALTPVSPLVLIYSQRRALNTTVWLFIYCDVWDHGAFYSLPHGKIIISGRGVGKSVGQWK